MSTSSNHLSEDISGEFQRMYFQHIHTGIIRAGNLSNARNPFGPWHRTRTFIAHGLSRALTAVLFLAFLGGLYQLGSVASDEFNKPHTITGQSAAAGPVKPAVTPGMARSAPTRLEIPAIGVDATFAAVGQTATGALDVPPHDFVGWYTGAPTPGEVGPAIVVGHVDSVLGPAVFWDLDKLAPGDPIRISREDGSIVNFVVQKSETYDQQAFPSQAVYGNINYPGLRLITCDGDFNYATRHYTQNLVVYAKKTP